MSTHILGDVQLLTKQEIEAMLSAVVVPEEKVEKIVQAEAESRETGDKTLASKIESEKNSRIAADEDILKKLADEAHLRNTGDDELRNRISDEEEARKAGDEALAKSLEKEIEARKAGDAEYSVRISGTFPNAQCVKLKKLGLCQMTVHNTDKSLHVGDTVATISSDYFPAVPVDFIMFCEQDIKQGDGVKTVLVTCRLDTAGNVNVVNLFDVTGATSATDTATVIYVTKE